MLQRIALATLAFFYLIILPQHLNYAQLTNNNQQFDSRTRNQDPNTPISQYTTRQPLNQYGRGRNSDPNQLLTQQGDNQRNNPGLNPNVRNGQLNDPNVAPNQQGNQFYDQNPNRFAYNRNNLQNYGGNYGGQGGFYGNQIDGVNPNDFCPEHWIAFRTSCYRFIKSPKRSWFEAKKICQAYQSDLVNVDSVEKQKFLTKELYLENQVHNRYYISARQTSPNNWVNDDNTQLFSLEDSFSYEESALDQDNYSQYLDNNHLSNSPNIYKQTNANANPQRNQSPNTYNIYDNRFLNKDRVVYGYSRSKDRWVYMPTYDFEHNLYICESIQLYSIENVNRLDESRRGIDYGFEIVDPERIPRGPYFIREPNETTYDTGKRKITNDVSMICIAGGWPTPTYTWYKEEYVNDNLTYTKIDPLMNDRYTISGGNLIIYNPEQQLDQGTYHCVAENKFGRILSESVQLNFGYILEFNLKRAAESGEQNWGKAMFCDPPQHYPGVKYYWSRDFFPNFVEEDQRVFVSYDGALYFSALETIDRGNYSCTVQSLVSDTGRNGPFFPLRVKPHPNYQALLFANSFPKVFPDAPVAGDEIRLECIAFGYPVPNYNWTRMDGRLPKKAYMMNYNRILIIPNATVNDNGEYLCTAKNDRKSQEKSVHVSIQMRPNFTIPLRDQIKDYNSEVNWVCEAYAIPDANYTWYRNGELLDREKLDRDKYIIQDNVLTIKYLDPEKDNGMYQCKATNQLRASYSSAQLRVLSMKPSFKKRPLESEIYAIANGNTTILCDPEAAPRPKFQWKKDGNVIGAGGHRRILPSGALIISPTSRDDEGIYTCVASNAYGVDESRARLIVLQELRFLQSLPPRTITEIDRFLYMQCDVYHDELLDVAFIWTHNGQIINEHADQINHRMVVNYNTLEIHNLTLLDGGTYECIAKSAVNQIATRTEVTVLGPPGMPGGVRVIEIKKTDASLEWIDGTVNGRPIMYYNILGRTNWNKTWTNISQGVVAHEVDRYTGRKRAEVTNLTPYCSYEFAVAAVNDLGIGPQSAPSPAHNTLHDLPYIAPRNVGGGGGKIGDLTITWDALKPEEQNSVGIHYKIFWRLHGKVGETEWAPKVLSTQGNTGQAVVHIPFDNYYTKYDVKVQAINDQGMGPESNVSTIYSAEDMPQVSPSQTVGKGFNSTAMNVTWNPVEITRERIRGKLIGHRVS